MKCEHCLECCCLSALASQVYISSFSVFFSPLNDSYQSSPQAAVTVASDSCSTFIRDREPPYNSPSFCPCFHAVLRCCSLISPQLSSIFYCLGKFIFECLRSFEQNFNKYNMLKTANTNIAGLIALKNVSSFMHVYHTEIKVMK